MSQLCDDRVDCPKADDEDPMQCAFYRQVSTSSNTKQEMTVA